VELHQTVPPFLSAFSLGGGFKEKVASSRATTSPSRSNFDPVWSQNTDRNVRKVSVRKRSGKVDEANASRTPRCTNWDG
jgi:hypothetical protein